MNHTDCGWKKNHASLILKTTRNCRMYVIFRLCFLSKGLHHSEMYLLFHAVCCVWAGILHEAAGQPGQRLPWFPHQQKGQTETPGSYWWHWPSKKINDSRPPRLKAWSQWKSATTMELSVCIVSFLTYVLLPLYIFVWMLFNATVHQYQFFWMC